MSLIYSKAEEREREKDSQICLGLAAASSMHRVTYTSRVVKIFSEALILSISYTAFARLPTYIRLVSTISSTL